MFYALTLDGRGYCKYLTGNINSVLPIHWLMPLHEALLNANAKHRDTHAIIEADATTHVTEIAMAIKKLIRAPID